MLRWSANDRSQIPIFRQHTASDVAFPFQLCSDGNEEFDTPVFCAQVSHGPDETGNFELKVIN